MKIFLHFITVYLLSNCFSEAFRLGNLEKNLGELSIPINVKVLPECALALREVAKTQLKYLDKQRAWLEEELELNQQNRALFTQISKEERSVIRSDEKPREEANSAQGIISNSLNKTGNVAGDILNTAGKLAKDDIEMKASVIGGALDGAGQAASSALQKSGQAAAQAASNIDNSLKNTYTRFGK